MASKPRFLYVWMMALVRLRWSQESERELRELLMQVEWARDRAMADMFKMMRAIATRPWHNTQKEREQLGKYREQQSRVYQLCQAALELKRGEWPGTDSRPYKDAFAFAARPTGERWAAALGWFIPRKYRHVIGDILEDCAEMREAGCTERRIKFHVVYQWVIAVIMLVPTAVKTSIVDAVRQALSRPR
ncbi:MAG: hypothetical protein ACYTE3_04215 [Planctomycetota bacterium]|jgi:hypothetical protein